MGIAAVAEQAVQQVTGGKGNFLSALFKGPMGAIGGLFGGLFNGALWIGGPLAALQWFFPSLVDKAVNALGLKEKFDEALTAMGGDTPTNRALALLGLGGAAGGVFGAAKGGISSTVDAMGGDGKKAGDLGGAVIGVGLAILATSVVLGAVKNGNLKLDSDHSAVPAKGAKSQETQGNVRAN